MDRTGEGKEDEMGWRERQREREVGRRERAKKYYFQGESWRIDIM